MSPSLCLLTTTDVRPNFLLNAEISPLTEPTGPYQPLNRCSLESGYETKSMLFCPRTERWDRTPGTEMPFCPRPRRFVPGQKGGTERRDRKAGQKGGTERPGTFELHLHVQVVPVPF